MLPAAAQAQQSLKFFKNYFHTGGHFAAGVSLKGTGVGGFAQKEIQINRDDTGKAGLPLNADILAAFLYWETVTDASGNGTVGAEFKGHSISAAARFLNPSGTPPCWSTGGATGGGSGAKQMKAYRADVTPFLTVDPQTNKRTGIGLHTVRLPDVGTGNSVPATAGATLFFIYSLPGNQTLNSTVVFDGGFTLNQTNPSHTLTLGGWYQASGSPSAYMTQIVGNGQSNFGETVTFNGGAGSTMFANPFTGQSGASDGQAGVWDTFTTPVSLNPGAAAATVTTSRASSNGSFDCLSWGAIILTTSVEDNEKDNIVDVLESATTSGTITDPTTGEKVPDLYAMGARTWNRDIFIEIGFMRSKAGYGPNALGQTIPANHTHLPDREALNMVATSFNAQGFKLHFDVGGNYQKTWSSEDWLKCFQQANPSWTTDCAIVPVTVVGSDPAVSLADGGEYIEETPCSLSTESSCLFHAYPGPLQCSLNPQVNYACRFDFPDTDVSKDVPGTVVWKSGFRYYRDEPLTHRTAANGLDTGPDEGACIIAETDSNPGSVCKRRFARNRHDWFRYSLWIHATGIPRDSNPAQPRNVSGIGDFLGADHQVSLGLWDFAKGTTFTQASTFMHEIGHGLGLRHGAVTGQPNCKPNYQSVMNYLFQIRGLINDLTGVAEIGYSNQILNQLKEGSLIESQALKTTDGAKMQWRTRWYTDWSLSFIDNMGGLKVTPVAKRCNGRTPEDQQLMARVDGGKAADPVDWNADGSIAAAGVTVQSDLNFSGLDQNLPYDDLAAGSNDWVALNLLTIGSRRNVGGWSVESGYWDTGYWDTGSDTGYWDTGYWDTGAPGDLNDTIPDAGYWDTGYWDTGYWDTGYWDTGAESDSADVPQGEIDLETAAALGNAPNAVTVQIPPRQNNPVVSWLPPHVKSDNVMRYEVYRVEGQTVTQTNLNNRVTVSNNVPPTQLSVTDTAPLKGNTFYIYLVLAQFNETHPITGFVRSGVAMSQPFRK